jgi:predicted nucleic acid-binding protein
MYRKLRSLAKARKRSLSAEVLTLLDREIQREDVDRSQAAVLGRIQRRLARRKPLPAGAGTLEMLREDRAR